MAARETKWHRGVGDVTEEHATPLCKKSSHPSADVVGKHTLLVTIALWSRMQREQLQTPWLYQGHNHIRASSNVAHPQYSSCWSITLRTYTHARTHTQGIKTRGVGVGGANAMAPFRLVPRCTCHRALVIKASSATRPSQHCCLCPILVPRSVIIRKLLTSRH